MLDKTSERILHTIIDKCGQDPTKEVIISEKDFLFPKSSLNFIYSVCEELHKNNYIKELSYLYQTSKDIEITLTYKGFSYFEYKKINKKEYIKQLLTTSVCSLIVSVLAAILTTVLCL